MKVTDTYGLPATATVSVTVFAAPTVQIVPSGEALTAQPLSFKVTSSTPEGTNLTDYQVSYGDGTAIQYGDGTPAATLSHMFGTPGVYTVILDAFNDADGQPRQPSSSRSLTWTAPRPARSPPCAPRP